MCRCVLVHFNTVPGQLAEAFLMSAMEHQVARARSAHSSMIDPGRITSAASADTLVKLILCGICSTNQVRMSA